MSIETKERPIRTVGMLGTLSNDRKKKIVEYPSLFAPREDLPDDWRIRPFATIGFIPNCHCIMWASSCS